MNSRTNYIILAALILLIAGGATGYFMWNKPHTDLTADVADFNTNPTELFEKFNTDEAAANQTYLNKVVELTGTISEKKDVGDQGAVILLEVPGEMFGINCAFEPADVASLESLEVGSNITLRGKVTGMAFDVNLARCVKMN